MAVNLTQEPPQIKEENAHAQDIRILQAVHVSVGVQAEGIALRQNV